MNLSTPNHRHKWRQLRELSNRSFFHFIRIVNPPPPKCAPPSRQIHKPLCDFFQDKTIYRKAIAMPRDWLKSSLYTKWGVIYDYLQNNECRILIAAENENLAGRFLQWIERQVLTNKRLRNMYPELKQVDKAWTRSHKWSKSECDLPRHGTYSEPTITAIGVGGAAQSGHYDVVAIDDLVGKKAKESPMVLESVMRWLDNAPELLVQPFRDMPSPSTIRIIGCLTGDSNILLSSGQWKKIVDIIPGDKVISFDGNDISENTVKAFIPQGEDDVFEIKTKYSSVKANARHPFLKIKKDGKVEWSRLDSLSEGDSIVATGNLNIGTPRRGRYIEEDMFPWLLGMIIGDGSITPHRTTVATCIARSIYPELTEKTIKAVYEITGRVPKTKNNAIYVWNKDFGNYLLNNISVARGAKNKRVPSCVYGWPVQDRIEFVRGLLDADGHQGGGEDYYYLSSCSRGLVEDIQILIKTCGIYSGKIGHRIRNVPLPYGRGPIRSEEFTIGINFREKPLWDNPEFRSEKILKITPLGKEPVYDISIQGSNNFVANGLFVHNTFWFPGDFLCYVRDKYPEYKFKVVPCRKTLKESRWPHVEYIQNQNVEAGESNWPEQFPTEYYVEMLANPEKNIDYWAQHMNDPEQATELTTFDVGWYKYYHFEEEGGYKYIVCEDDKERFRVGSFLTYAFLDPGGFTDKRLTKSGSRTAILVGGQPSGTRKKFVTYTWAGRYKNPDKFMDEIFKANDVAKPVLWRQEIYAQQRYILDDIKKEAKKRGKPLRIIELESDERKDAKALNIDALKAPMFNGEIYIHASMKDLISETQVYPNGTTKDILDCLAQLNKTYWKRGEKKSLVYHSSYQERVSQVESRTGY